MTEFAARFWLDSPSRLCYMPGLSGPGSGQFDGRIAQLVEQLTLNQRVQGSSPCAPTIEINDLPLICLERFRVGEMLGYALG